MGHIAYWTVFIIFLVVLVWLIVTKRFIFSDYVMYISMVALAKILNHMLGIAFELFYYVQLGKTIFFYAFFYDIVVYPTVGVIFSKLYPKHMGLSSLIKYNLFWIIFSVMFEAVIAYPLRIIIYTRWRIFPYSLLSYSVIFPILSWYKLLLDKKIPHVKSES